MPSTPSLPSGLRVYAIGDIHGCLSLVQQLLEKIEADHKKRGGGKHHVIFLGDYIDRGLHSRGVIDFLIDWHKKQKSVPIYLLGNHEQVMRSILAERDKELLDSWLTFGGRETLMSYGVRPVPDMKPDDLINELIKKTPANHVSFLNKLQLSASFGDYFFCHAGVRPGIPLDNQEEDDMVWIRNEFLGYSDSFGKVIVHGHSIRLKAEFKSNRIGIDTGAYATGRLTALALEGTNKWVMHTG